MLPAPLTALITHSNFYELNWVDKTPSAPIRGQPDLGSVDAERARLLRYRDAIEHMGDGFFVLGRDLRLSEVNDALCTMLGYARAELLGQSPLMLVTDESGRRMQTQLARIDVTTMRRNQYDAARKDGTLLPVLVRALSHRDAQGRLESSIGFVTDLTEFVLAQEMVASSERELRGILDNLQDTYYRTDIEGRVVRVAGALRTLLGYSEAEVLGLHLADFYCDSADRDRFVLALRNSGGAVTHYEARLRHRDGREIWVSTNAQYVRGKDGVPCGIEGTTRDITELLHSREELRLAARVFSSAVEAIAITDPDLNLISVNDAFTLLTGCEPDAARGQRLSCFAETGERERFERAWRDALAARGSWSGEMFGRSSNGARYCAWLTLSPVRDQGGQVTHCVAFLADHTERKLGQARMEFLAHHDALTELPNRVLFSDRVEQSLARARRSLHGLALLFVDLDDFKSVNDSLGHLAGDQLLRSIARSLVACLRESDTIGRHGGDEFLIAVSDVADRGQAQEVADKVMKAVAGPHRVDDQDVVCGCSIGVALRRTAAQRRSRDVRRQGCRPQSNLVS